MRYRFAFFVELAFPQTSGINKYSPASEQTHRHMNICMETFNRRADRRAVSCYTEPIL